MVNMPVTVLDNRSDTDALGVRFRRASDGPERELVDWFLERQPVRTPGGCRWTIFREPRLESGVPDLVLVAWSVAVAKHWNQSRAALTMHDIRLMQHIQRSSRCQHSELRRIFGKDVLGSVERLEAAGMVRRSKDAWLPLSLSKSYAVRAIVAVEAKVRDWRTAIDQAFLNTWFATTSCVLLPRLPQGSHVLEAACNFGVTVWTKEAAPFVLGYNEHGHQPFSYASWLFNEWAWRAARVNGNLI